MNEEQNPSPVTALETAAHPRSRTIYFAVSPLKLVVMAICTFGVYEIYWHYRHWGYVRERENSDIMPFGRAIFAPFFCYSLFKSIQSTGRSNNISRSIAAGHLAAGWIVFRILAKLPNPIWLVTFLSVLFLVPVQMLANDVNLATSPNHDRNNKFSKWNLGAILVGGLLFVLMLLGTFLPSE